VAYVPADEEVSVVAAGVRNGADPLFVYYTGDYPADMTPLSPDDLTKIKYIELRLLIDTNEEIDPPPIEIVSQVQLRNLKTNLAEEVGSEE
jgi:hypothetical protein